MGMKGGILDKNIEQLKSSYCFLSLVLSAASPAADGAAAATAADFGAGGDQRGGSTRRQHGRHGGASGQEEEDHPDGPEQVLYRHDVIQIHGEEIQLHLVLFHSRHPELSENKCIQ